MPPAARRGDVARPVRRTPRCRRSTCFRPPRRPYSRSSSLPVRFQAVYRVTPHPHGPPPPASRRLYSKCPAWVSHPSSPPTLRQKRREGEGEGGAAEEEEEEEPEDASLRCLLLRLLGMSDVDDADAGVGIRGGVERRAGGLPHFTVQSSAIRALPHVQPQSGRIRTPRRHPCKPGPTVPRSTNPRTEKAVPAIREACAARAECAPMKHHFEKCQEKVEAGKGFKGEECVEELSPSSTAFGRVVFGFTGRPIYPRPVVVVLRSRDISGQGYIAASRTVDQQRSCFLRRDGIRASSQPQSLFLSQPQSISISTLTLCRHKKLNSRETNQKQKQKQNQKTTRPMAGPRVERGTYVRGIV
ncbi:hypothetical protein B0H16DRAFT_1698578 [Mycena metata]|uniref:Ubiquinol-cytochrome C reductase hinge domain-containing protein n=1 Tax=Mycena metata TaxID=1033252 RepID=A0AAD7HP86_9AGAR|nr:hypothetical protein B0H16DRAFT_1698578 [Mycena metata]